MNQSSSLSLSPNRLSSTLLPMPPIHSAAHPTRSIRSPHRLSPPLTNPVAVRSHSPSLPSIPPLNPGASALSMHTHCPAPRALRHSSLQFMRLDSGAMRALSVEPQPGEPDKNASLLGIFSQARQLHFTTLLSPLPRLPLSRCPARISTSAVPFTQPPPGPARRQPLLPFDLLRPPSPPTTHPYLPTITITPRLPRSARRQWDHA